MATVNPKTKCSVCKKETRTFICEGCSRKFCRNDLTKHLQTLSEELDKIENNHDELRQKIRDQNNDLFIQEINQWEENSIEKIKQTADKCREKLIKCKNNFIIELENKLNDLAKQLKEIRQENEFNEMDLNQFKDELRKLEEEFNKPLNILTEQKPTSFINKICVIIPFNKDSKWEQVGLTIAGGNGNGNQLNQLFRPEGLFVDHDQIIYIADSSNDRIVEWKSDGNIGRIVAGGRGQGKETNQLNYPTDVIIDKDKNSFIIADRGNRRVIQWTCQDNTTNGKVIIEDIDCYGLTLAKNGDLYVSDSKKNEVRRWKRGEKIGTIVAGGNEKGDCLNQLNFPTYIFVDEEYSLYVTDNFNHRVMKWVKGARQGIVVAGGNGQGNSLTQLSYPQGVIVDQFRRIYIVDSSNQRVMRWCCGAAEGTIVVGGNGCGKEFNQFNSPYGLSFGRQGDLYIVDEGNHRIQKFEID